jgi:hypothetical protein
MIDDQRLADLLRTALPAVETTDGSRPSHDLWPAVVQRAAAREPVSTADLGVAAVIVIVLLMFPQWFWFLAYQL